MTGLFAMAPFAGDKSSTRAPAGAALRAEMSSAQPADEPNKTTSDAIPACKWRMSGRLVIKIAISPHPDALRISGTLELVGEDLSVDRRRVAAMVRDAAQMLDLGEVSTADVDVWRGLRPCMPDGMPAIGRARGARNVWLATGHQMTGLKTAPGTGRLLAELISGETPSLDPAPFRADRF